MNSDTKELYELLRENNEILRGMRRNARIGSFFRFLYWAFFIGSAIGLYYYLQPFIEIGRQNIDQVRSVIEEVRGAAGSLEALPKSLGTLLENARKATSQ